MLAPGRLGVALLVLLLALLMAQGAMAYPRMVFEREPNDTLEQAQSLRGEAQLMGEVSGDDRDLFRWNLDEAEADQRWRLELHSEGRVSVELERVDAALAATERAASPDGVTTFGGGVASFGEAPSVDEVESFGEVKSADVASVRSETGSDPSGAWLTLTTSSGTPRQASEGLMIPAGEYRLRFESEGGEGAGGEYRLTLAAEDRISIHGTIDPDAAGNLAVRAGRQWYFQLNVPEAIIPLALEGEPQQLWRLNLLGELGTPLEAWVEDADGNIVANVTEETVLRQQWGQLVLAEGSRLHLRHTQGDAIGRIGVAATEDGWQAVPVAEPDTVAIPGSRPEQRVWIAPGDSQVFPVARNQQRYLAFHVAEHDAPLRLAVAAEGEATWQVCLAVLDARDEICRQGPHEALFSSMRLAPGDYGVRVRREGRDNTENLALTLSLHTDEAPAAGWLHRPADSAAWAFPLLAAEPVRGRFEHSQEAWFDLHVSGEVQQWKLTTESDEPLSRLSLFRAGESEPLLDRRRSRGEQHPLWLDNLRLLPGHYRIRLNGEGTDFQLLASPRGRAQPGLELEPNDQDSDANPLWLGQPVHGNFHSDADEDRFHFHLPGWNRVAMELEPPAEGSLSASLEWGGVSRIAMTGVEEPAVTSQWLPPGDYLLVLNGRATPEPYRVTLSVVDPWSPPGRVPPAPLREWAPMMAEDGLVMPDLGANNGYLRLPVSAQDRQIELQGRLGVLAGDTVIELHTSQGEPIALEQISNTRRTAIIPGGESVLLEARFGNRVPGAEIIDPAYPLPQPLPLDIDLTSDVARVASFARDGQRVASRLSLSNPEPQAQVLPLTAHISHAGGTVTGLPDALTLEPGEQVELALIWTLPPNVLESADVALFVRAGEHVVQHRLQPQREASPVDPVARPEVPEPLLGKTNLAWNALGATFVDADNGEPIDDLPQQFTGHAHFLLDDMASANTTIEVHASGNRALPLGTALPPIRLAGEGGRIHGLAFNQRSMRGPLTRWREIEIALGAGHDDLDVVMTVELDAADGEQFFVLDEPRHATHVQLRPLGIWGESVRRGGSVGTGLLRVLGEPTGALADHRHNLLERELGGHWVYTLPDLERLRGLQEERIHYRSVMGPSVTRLGEPIRGRSVEMVFAFLQQRAARIERLQWQDELAWQGVPVERVNVYTATESPVGPWHAQADWTLERDADGMAELVLEEAPWARYVRLVIEEPEAGTDRQSRNWRIPASLAAFEAETLGGGRSVLGHWGIDHSRGPLEAGQQGAQWVPEHAEDVESHADAPWTLREQVTGRVEEPGDARHYRIELPQGDNTLTLRLQESQRGRLLATLRDAEGQEVALPWRDDDSGQRLAETAVLAPGEYHLSVAEPPRSVVFIWDGSGSVASHQPAIYQALNRFAEGLEAGREVFNMLPLGGPLLIDGWAESPSQVAATLAAYDNRFDGSDSEPALRLAARALERQAGERAIFLITDAEQVGRDLSVWNDLARVRPRIFSLEIAHGNQAQTEANRWYQHQMMSWAHVGNGHYRYTTDRSGLVRAFEEGMQLLRQPTRFALEVDSHYQEPPEPGSLTVVSADPEQPVIAAGAVHLIFDASGSMLRQMEGGRRIEVARRIVQQVLDERIPAQVPVALRAFGHTAPHSCATELLVTPSADNHAAVRRAVGEIQAINLARTALADSLDAVLDDLSDYAGQRRLVVMLTDGEETCDGDLEQSVRQLVAEGVDIRLNIVGFHIDELGLQAEFERFAELGGGEYFDSHDGDELIESLASALAAPWRVVDGRGAVVARGRVDDGQVVELEVGAYDLVMETQSGEWRREFSVAPRQAVEITAGE